MRLGVFRALLVTLAFCCIGLPVAADTFNFTVTADPRQYDDVYDNLLAQLQSKIGGQGVFQILCGDIDPPWNIRTRIDNRFGTSAVWYPGVGNHETETTEDMTWLRNEYTIGNDGRTPLKNFTNQDGPAGSVETTYSWDYGNAHFIMLNEYWDGGTSAGSDVARDGDVVPALLSWLSANLAATDKPVIFVCGHEPAYPENRHVGDSLDLYPANRDAFWNLLESDTRVKAYFCGHTHYYSRHIQPGGRVWQVDAGNAANDPGDGKTFINTTVTDSEVTFDVWRDGDTGVYSLYESWSVPVVVVPPTQVDTPAEAKQQADETSVQLTAGVSAVFPGFFYVENSQRTSGIRVDHSLQAPAAGTEVTITGYAKTNADGERYIEAVSYTHLRAHET